MITDNEISPPDERDVWADHREGRIFTRGWVPLARPPTGAQEQAPEQAPEQGLAPIVMFHDSLGCVEMWRGFPAALAQATGRVVVAYDRLGFGRSAARAGSLSPGFVAEEAARYLPAVLGAWGIRRFVALGHSVGGGMAIEAAAHQGAACEALVTMAAQVFAEDRTLEGIRAAREQFKDPAQVERLAKYHGDKARWVLDAWIDTWLSAAFADWSLAPVLPRVAAPTLAIHGEQDEYGTTRHATMIGALSGGPATVELLPGIGHVPQREQPAQTVARVAQFLAGRH